MPTYSLKTAGRQYKRQFDKAIRENLIRALTELITNSDDSYSKLEEFGNSDSGNITIIYDRGEKHISVIDEAEGLNSEEMRENFVDYGAAVSGLKEGKSVRGYFGKGIKDVLFSMKKGRVRSIVDGKLYVAKFIWRGGKPKIEISDRSHRVNRPMRESLLLDQNGTVVDFNILDTITNSRHDTVLRNLSNFYMLRRINSNPNRKVTLITHNANGQVYEEQVKYNNPIGEILLSDNFDINIDGFSPFQIDLELSKSNEALTQEGEDREGGILVIDESDVVLDLTLFDYDRDTYAENLFGLLRIHNFRELLKVEERVLSDSRDGLDTHHNFYILLQEEVRKRIKPIIEAERKKQQREYKNISQENKKRLDDSIDKINELLNELTAQDWFQGSGISDSEQEISGIQFSIKEINIVEGVKTRVRLIINSNDIPSGTEITFLSNNRKILVSPESFVVASDNEKKHIDKYITLEGKQVGEEGVITAKTLAFECQLKVQVIEDKYPKPSKGFSFIPDVIKVTNNEKSYAYVYFSEDVGNVGDELFFSSDNPNIQVLNKKTIIERKLFRNDIARIGISIIGSGIGQEGKIVATLNQMSTSLSVEVISKRTRKKRGKSGLISGYDFSEKPSRKRSYYEDDTGIIWVFIKHPTISKYYSGIDRDMALSLPHCQLLLAEVILEEVAKIARKKMIEANKVMYLGDDRTQEDLIEIERFKYQYGNAIHSWIVDDNSIETAIDNQHS